MAQSINNTYPVQISVRLTQKQNAKLKAVAASQNISVRAVIRTLIDNHIRGHRLLMSFTPEVMHDLEAIAKASGTTPEYRAAVYVSAGIALERGKYDIDSHTAPKD